MTLSLHICVLFLSNTFPHSDRKHFIKSFLIPQTLVLGKYTANTISNHLGNQPEISCSKLVGDNIYICWGWHSLEIHSLTFHTIIWQQLSQCFWEIITYVFITYKLNEMIIDCRLSLQVYQYF